MKKILLFAGEDYYPSGGINDFKGEFDSLELADNAVIENAAHEFDNWEWYQMVDKETMKIINYKGYHYGQTENQP